MGFRVQVLGFIDLVVARLGSRNQSLERGAIGNDLDFVFSCSMVSRVLSSAGRTWNCENCRRHRFVALVQLPQEGVRCGKPFTAQYPGLEIQIEYLDFLSLAAR